MFEHSGLLGERFRLEMMVPQRSKESPKTSEVLPFSLPVAIQKKLDNMKDRGISNSTVELNKTVIHQRHIPGQHGGAGISPSRISEEGKMVDTYGEEKERRRKYKVVFLTG